MTNQHLWTRAAALLAEHRTEDALYAYITGQLAPLVASGHQEGIEEWRQIAGMIDQLVAAH